MANDVEASQEHVSEQAVWDEEMQVRLRWFHVLQSTITEDIIAKVGPAAWCVYCVIKAYSDMKTGFTNVGQDKIAKHIGRSNDVVGRQVRVLEQHGMLKVHRRGRHLEYQVIESMPVYNAGGDKVATATAPYVPTRFGEMNKQMDEIAKTGILDSIKGGGNNITINLSLTNTTINQAEGSSANVVLNPPALDNPTFELNGKPIKPAEKRKFGALVSDDIDDIAS